MPLISVLRKVLQLLLRPDPKTTGRLIQVCGWGKENETDLAQYVIRLWNGSHTFTCVGRCVYIVDPSEPDKPCYLRSSIKDGYLCHVTLAGLLVLRRYCAETCIICILFDKVNKSHRN